MSAPLPLDTWLVRAICAYRAGRARPVAMSEGPSGALFRSRTQAFIESRLPEDQYRHYAAVRDLSRSAVTFARAQDFARSDAAFAQAEALLADAGRSEEMRLLARSWISQASAYLAVRRKDWQAARDCLTSAMDADLALEETFGYDIFHIGRVHTLHLWLRVEAESGRPGRAIDIARQVAEYVNGDRASLPIGSGWSAARAAAVPPEFRFAMTARIAGEAGAVLARCEQADVKQLLARFPVWRVFAGHGRLSEIHEWGAAKDAFASGDTTAFLERAELMLARGRRETTLWYATALDLCRVLQSLRHDATVSFRDEVRDDASLSKELPEEVQAPVLAALLTREQREDRAAVYRHRLPARRFHVYTVGLPRTGTTSLYTLFQGFRTGNEFMERETIGHCVARHQGTISPEDFAAYLDRRDEEGGLEMDAASFHHLYFDELLARRPAARFIFTIRSPYEWTNSYLRMLHGWHARFTAAGEAPPEWMENYGRMLLGDFSWDWVASKAAIQEQIETLADTFVAHWAQANRRTLARLPMDRSLVIRTEELSSRRADIERFAGLQAGTLTGSDRSNVHPDQSDLLTVLGRPWIDARAALHGADMLEMSGMTASGAVVTA
jgi:hypothetical protein